MGYNISIYRQEDIGLLDQEPQSNEELHRLLDQQRAAELYSRPLGSEGKVGEYWAKVGHELGLPLISSLPNEELRLNSSQLPALEAELDQLEDYWSRTTLPGVDNSKSSQEFLKEYLQDGLNSLREATQIAKSKNAILVIL